MIFPPYNERIFKHTGIPQTRAFWWATRPSCLAGNRKRRAELHPKHLHSTRVVSSSTGKQCIFRPQLLFRFSVFFKSFSAKSICCCCCCLFVLLSLSLSSLLLLAIASPSRRRRVLCGRRLLGRCDLLELGAHGGAERRVRLLAHLNLGVVPQAQTSGSN